MWRLQWALDSHVEITGICGFFETTKVKMGRCTERTQTCMRAEFVGHPGNSVPFSSTTIAQCPFVSPSKYFADCVSWPLAQCSLYLPQHTGFAPRVAGASMSLEHLLFYFLYLNGIRNTPHLMFSVKMLFSVIQPVSALHAIPITSITWIFVEQFIMLRS